MSCFAGRIIVTGGAGFIGSALIWALNQRGLENILVVDLLGSSDKWKNLAPLRFADYMEGDVFRQNLEHFSDSTLLLHMGACSATTETDVRYLIDNNYSFTQELADFSLTHGVRFVYASSAATYGDGSQGMSDEARLHDLRPLNAYGYSKHLFDLYAQRRGWLDSMVGLKYFNVFGPNENHKGDMRSMVHKAYGQVRDSGRVALFRSHHPDFGDGRQQRDFLYVKDAAAMTLHLADSPANGLFNLGSGRASTWLELVEPVFAACGLEPAIDFIDLPENLRDKYQYFTQADISRLRASGFRQELTPLSDAVRETVGYLARDLKLGDEERLK